MSERAVLPQRAVLIVDDNLVNLELYQELMTLTDYLPVAVSRADAVLAATLSHRPGLVLLDLTLPDSSGFVVARVLKDNPETSHIPIIALTAVQRDNLTIELGAAGFAGLVSKPCGVETFLEAVTWGMEVTAMEGATGGFRIFR